MKLILITFLSALFALGCTEGGGSNPTPNPTPTPEQPKFSCQNPLGGIIKHGESVTLFKSANVPFNQACVSETRTCDNGVLSGTATFEKCEVLPEPEPESHEKPIRLSEEGLKRGGIKKLGEISMWKAFEYDTMFSPRPTLASIPNCTPSVEAGTTCNKNASICKKDTLIHQCNTETSRKIFGWVYEKKSVTEYVPMNEVRVEFYRFTDCMLNGDKCHIAETFTDKFGYFEYIEQGGWHDTLSTKSPAGFYGYCAGKKMIYVNGSNYAYAKPEGEAAFGVFNHSKIVDPDICSK